MKPIKTTIQIARIDEVFDWREIEHIFPQLLFTIPATRIIHHILENETTTTNNKQWNSI